MHGSGLTNMIFLPRRSWVIELSQQEPQLGHLASSMGLQFGTCSETSFSNCLKDNLNRRFKLDEPALFQQGDGAGALTPKDKKAAAAVATAMLKAHASGGHGSHNKDDTDACSTVVHAALAKTTPPPRPTPASCFTVPLTAKTSSHGALYEFYHFLIELAAPIVYLLKDAPHGPKVLYLPDWAANGELRSTVGQQSNAAGGTDFHLTHSTEPARTMQHHANFLFEPLGLVIK
jgi:hypothetical protein